MDRATKGVLATMQRACSLPIRYGLTPNRMRARLQQMAQLLARRDSIGTVTATASTIARHPELVRDLRAFDVAIHGFHHTAYAGKAAQVQADDLDSARRVFERFGLECRGFRAPYLSEDGATLRLLRERRFLYDSSSPHYVLPLQPSRRDMWDLARLRYPNLQHGPSQVRCVDGLARIPVSLPDDEILIDGLGVRSTLSLTKVFAEMMDACQATAGHLVIQVHPERVGFCAEALANLIDRAIDADAWIAPLVDVARWSLESGSSRSAWPKTHSFALSVTGDLDAAALSDFAYRIWGA